MSANVMAWLQVIPIVVFQVCALFIPGVLIVKVVQPHTRFFSAVAQAPIWTLGIVAIASILSFPGGLSWNCGGALISFAVALILAIVWRMLVTRFADVANVSGSIANRYIASSVTKRWQELKYLLGCILAWLVYMAPVFALYNPTIAVQGSDSDYHYNQLMLMYKTGIASPLFANATMLGLDPTPWYYPDTWHAFLVLGMGVKPSAVLIANSFTAVTTLTWIIGIFALTHSLFPRNPAIKWWSLAVIGMFPLPLNLLQFSTSLWPFVLGFVILPGLFAALLHIGYLVLAVSKSKGIRQGIKYAFLRYLPFGIPLIGAVGAHPSTLVPILTPAFSFILLAILRASMLRFWNKQPVRGAGYICLLVVMITGAVAFIWGPGPQSYQFSRFPEVNSKHVSSKLIGATLTSSGHYEYWWNLFQQPLLFFLLVGLLVLLSQRAFLLPIFALSQWLITVACYLPLGPISSITSLYYNVASRAKVSFAIFAIPLIAIALEFFRKLLPELCATLGIKPRAWVRACLRVLVRCSKINALETKEIRNLRYFPIFACVSIMMLASVTLLIVPVRWAINQAVFPEHLEPRFSASREEVDLYIRAKDILPPNAFVMGDPMAGETLLMTLAGVKVVWPFHSLPQGFDDQVLLSQFNEIHTNPEVCRVIRKYGISHYLADEPIIYNNGLLSFLRPGLYYVDTSKGFTKIASGGTATLYSIDICYRNSFDSLNRYLR